MARIHILGASGSGTSTLGSALARRLGVPHANSDSFYWLPTDPPYTTPRPAEERQALLTRTAAGHGALGVFRCGDQMGGAAGAALRPCGVPAPRSGDPHGAAAPAGGGALGRSHPARRRHGGDQRRLHRLGRSLRHRRLAAPRPGDARGVAGGPDRRRCCGWIPSHRWATLSPPCWTGWGRASRI